MNRVAWSRTAWRGPSAIDGAEIVAYLTIGSRNAKTGDVATLWMMRADQSPLDAQRSGNDRSVCGNCILRPANRANRLALGFPRGCYVRTYRMHAMWARAVGLVPDLDVCCEAIRRYRPGAIRLGGYGDPGAIPESAGVIQALCDCGVKWLGYTHRWRQAAWLRPYCMASVETEHDAWQAWGGGWRTFRTAPSARPLTRLEAPCPASSHHRTCAQCMLCTGASRHMRSMTIPLHA